VFGISKQAYYQRIQTTKKKEAQHQIVLAGVDKIRRRMPRTGTRKLQEHLRPHLRANNIKMGRDALFALLRQRGLLVSRTKRYHITTDSKHYFYRSPNLLKDLEITHSEQVFVNDITYVKIETGHAYLALSTDAYSKKIMGWCLSDNMQASMVKEALKMAHSNMAHHHKTVIHHSDRGIQYCCPDYTDFAEGMGFVMSTTQKYDPYENAVAERINGILKYEFGLRKTLPNLTIARKMVKQAVAIYNRERLHWSLGLKTPEEVHRGFDKQKYRSYRARAA